jgi:mRNA interferase YafQ
MRTIEWTKSFKRDYKREAKGLRRTILDTELFLVVEVLALDHVLEKRFHDHALTGEWQDFRDCHIRPDLVLIYQKPDKNTLRLVRLGSHSEIGL